MDRKPETEIAMFNCHVCGHNAAKSELVSEVFTVEGRRVLVENIPAQVCEHCGEAVFFARNDGTYSSACSCTRRPAKTIPLDVFALA